MNWLLRNGKDVAFVVPSSQGGISRVSTPSDEVASYLHSAEACRVAAEVAGSPEVCALYLSLSNQWEALARQVEQGAGRNNRRAR